ncbi:hypothetical protein ACJIZ3_010662 [Penstemon smallii]|uniref:Uncharacterized protein n=1 Tax=Penstemon smallii TaxID=265156 RepID=A0ABD3UH81_9LAMI
MDFKGIKWAGNLYQKFEAMCLEVEDVTFEDTVKYVENQAQKAGVTVKKFYSEIMGDLLPPSYVDPIKVAAGDLSLNPYAHVDINKNPKHSILDEKKNTEDEVKLSIPNDAYNLSPQISKVLNEFRQRSKKIGIHKRPVGIKRISQSSCISKSSSLSEVRSSMASDDMNATTSSDFVLRHDPRHASLELSSASNKIISSETSDSKCASPAFETKNSADYMRQKMDDSECTSPSFDKDDPDSTSSGRDLPSEFIGTSLNSISFSQSSPSIRSNACEVETVGTSMKDGSFSQLNIISNIESAGKEVIMSSEEIKIIENAVISEPRIDNFSLIKSSKLEESCVFVEREEFHFVQGMEKHKSYKKKIQQALSSKLKSTRKQDQLVHKSGKNNNAGVMMDTDEGKSKAARDSFESDWELI